MKIEVRIETQLEELWSQLGLSDDQQDQEYENLNKQVQELFRSFLKQVYEEVQTAKKEAEQAEKAVADHISRFDLEVHGTLDTSLPYLQRIENAKNRLTTLQKATAEQQAEYEETYAELQKVYDILEIEDRGEFQEKGSSFSLDKIDKMNTIIDELNEQISTRQPQVEALCEQISSLNRDIGIPPVQVPQTCGDPTIEQYQTLLEKTKTLRDQNVENIRQLGLEIHRIERHLNINPKTNISVSVCSNDVVETFQKRFSQLETEKQNHLPEYIHGLKGELQELWDDLHIPTPTSSEFPWFYKNQISKRTLIALESEVKRLENMREQISPLLDLIAHREEILRQQQDLMANEGDTTRFTSRRSGAASQIMNESRIKKQIQTELPKIHTKMIKELEDYQQTYGEPFYWDGRNLLNEVLEAHKAEEVSNLQTQIRSQKKGESRKRPTRTGNLSQRAPFQLQEYMI